MMQQTLASEGGNLLSDGESTVVVKLLVLSLYWITKDVVVLDKRRKNSKRKSKA